MAFLGEYYCSFIGKGRLVIPKKIRHALGSGNIFTLSKGYDGCLAGYREKDWGEATKELISQSVVAGRGVDLRRHLFSSATKLEIDKQGRIIIPQQLLEYADVQNVKEAVFIGVGNHFEIWEPNRWSVYLKTVEEKVNKEKES